MSLVVLTEGPALRQPAPPPRPPPHPPALRYTIRNQQLQWADAVQSCTNLGLQLAQFDDRVDLVALVQLLDQRRLQMASVGLQSPFLEAVWLGARLNQSAGVWYWRDGLQARFLELASQGAPIMQGNASCLTLRWEQEIAPGTFSVVPVWRAAASTCDVALPFVCSGWSALLRPPPPPPPSPPPRFPTPPPPQRASRVYVVVDDSRQTLGPDFMVSLGISLGIIHLCLILVRCAPAWSKLAQRRAAPATVEVQPADVRAAAVRAARASPSSGEEEGATSMAAPPSDMVLVNDDERPSARTVIGARRPTGRTQPEVTIPDRTTPPSVLAAMSELSTDPAIGGVRHPGYEYLPGTAPLAPPAMGPMAPAPVSPDEPVRQEDWHPEEEVETIHLDP